MPDLPPQGLALAALVLLLGLRHGLDADHLSAVDGLTRVAARERRAHARWCGALFSLGHGAVVMAMATLAGLAGARWSPPAWFEPLGSLISIAFLALLGVANLHAVLRTPRHLPLAPTGLRGRAVLRLLGRAGASAAGVGGVGALFALSFDTLSLSALFSAMGLQAGGMPLAAGLCALFVLGMLLTSGANGWWVSHLIERSDQRAVAASRAMTLAVAAVSLLVAAGGLARLLSSRFAGWAEGRELAVGLAVLGVVALGYGLAWRAGRARPQHTAA